MRKREILKHYKSSLKKWEKILKDINGRKLYEYWSKHWKTTTCGFCELYYRKGCHYCPLGHYKGAKIHYCSTRACESLELADENRWPEAEKLCKQFIAKIKREIKKVEAK